MMQDNIMAMTVDELVQRFIAIALDQDRALFDDELTKFNRLYGEMDEIRNELRNRPGDQRAALLPLHAHPNVQVRLKAALTTMEIAPEAAREVFQEIVNSRQYPQAADALAAIWRLDGRPLVTR